MYNVRGHIFKVPNKVCPFSSPKPRDMLKITGGAAMVVTNITRNSVLANNCALARTFFARLMGLQFKRELPRGHGLLITPCNSIHMFFMRFAIDAVFIDTNGAVVYIREGIEPWRVSKIVGSARSVLELPVGTVSSTGTAVGDILELKLSNRADEQY